MNRGERRRRAREAKKMVAAGHAPQDQYITLSNPVTKHFESFIVGNAPYCDKVAVEGEAEGQTLVLCGAGPSLREHADDYVDDADQVWGCNSAAIWLHETGRRVTHAVTVDQTPAMVNEWRSAPDLEYLVASTIHPHLTEHLLEHGRSLTWFHNYVGLKKPPVEYCACGHDRTPQHDDAGCSDCECESYDPRMMEYEDWIYLALYPATMRAGSGLNTATRALDLAVYMGFEKIHLLGADCSIRVTKPLPEGVVAGTKAHEAWLREHTEMHADGGNALASEATPVTLGGTIDGRHWETKPDLAISAVFLVKMQEKLGADRLEIVGDTLPNAIRGKPDSFIDRLPALIDQQGNPIKIGAA